MRVQWVVGMDGGGTKTAALCKSSDPTHPLRRSEAGPCNVAAMDPVDAAANVERCLTVLNIVPGEVAALTVGVAGYSAASKRRHFTQILHARFLNAKVEVLPDYLIAHSGAFADGVGVIVVAGTGSVAYGVNPIGESAVVGGYGYLIDDAGTGYGLGRQVLMGASHTLDGIAGCDQVSNLFFEKTGIRTREDLIASVYGGALDRAAIAALAPIISEAASNGDSYASSILMHAGGALARLAQSAIAGLFAQPEPVLIAKAGSLWAAGGELSSVFERSLLRSCTLAKIVLPATNPLQGALKRASKLIDIE